MGGEGGERGERGEGDETSYQQEVKGGGVGPNLSEWVIDNFTHFQATAQLHLSILLATNSEEWLALRIREKATFNSS